jgi:hypothetical protein
MTSLIGKLQRVPLPEIWRHEALHFTPWLAEHIDVLSEALNLQLKVIETEKTVGSFSLDILAEDATSQPVIIENQIYKTDHDHLGKVVTYLTNLNAKTAIWISSDPRPEHIRAMAWLNEASPEDVSFYLIRLEAYRIGDSPAAPLFSKIVEPSPESKEFGKQREELAQGHVDRLGFWTELLQRAKGRTSLHANISPGKEGWVSAGFGIGGVIFSYVILMNDARVELYIDRGTNSDAQNKAIFDRLLSRREEIESTFGGPLTWERLAEKRACRISYSLGIGGLRDRENWNATQDGMIDAMVRLHASLAKPTEAAALAVPTYAQPPGSAPSLAD